MRWKGGFKMRKYKKGLCAFLFIIGLCFVGTENAFSEEGGPPLSIEPIYPDNQDAKVKGYFKIRVEPNQKQTVKIRITNNLEDDQKVIIQKANGFTNPVGGMLYRETIDSNDSILLDDGIKLVDHIDVESEVTIAGKDTVEIPIDISVPDVDSGTILGAVRIVTEGKADEKSVEVEEGTANFVLQTETAQSIAIQLDLPKTVEPSFSMGKSGFTLNGPSAYMEMKNNAQMIQENLSGEYHLEDTDGNQLFQGEIPTFNMAPKTQINYPFQWNNETLEDGDYTLFVTLNANGEEVVAEESFTIGNDEVEEYVERNQPVVPEGQVENGIPIWVWILAGAIILAGVMFWLGRRNR
jgi:hypothetical protein